MQIDCLQFIILFKYLSSQIAQTMVFLPSKGKRPNFLFLNGRNFWTAWPISKILAPMNFFFFFSSFRIMYFMHFLYTSYFDWPPYYKSSWYYQFKRNFQLNQSFCFETTELVDKRSTEYIKYLPSTFNSINNKKHHDISLIINDDAAFLWRWLTPCFVIRFSSWYNVLIL